MKKAPISEIIGQNDLSLSDHLPESGRGFCCSVRYSAIVFIEQTATALTSRCEN